MSGESKDTTVENLNNKPAKNPVEAALNKLREQHGKELQTKIDAQVKKCYEADKVAKNENAALQALLSELEEYKADMKAFVSGL